MFQKISLKEKVAIVTGASSGIGLEITKMLTAEGCIVIMVSKTYEKLKKISQEINSNEKNKNEKSNKTYPFQADVSNEEQMKDVVDKTIKQLKKIDILVNNAGIYKQQYIKNLDMSDFDETISTNLRGVAVCTKLVLPYMLEQNSGTIIMVSSGLGRHGAAGNSSYCASKFGLIGFAECLDLEVSQTNINVSTILPGQTNTPIFDFLGTHPSRERMLDPKYIADIAVYLCKLPQNVKIKEVSVRPKM